MLYYRLYKMNLQGWILGFGRLTAGVYNLGMPKIALVINNVRSANNVGSMLRSADGFGVSKVYICGYSPYPEAINDNRLPHIRQKATKAIHKTALGAEKTVDWGYQADVNVCLEKLEQNNYVLAALEQTDSALKLDEFNPKGDIALIVGNEICRSRCWAKKNP
jgi:23S rRNA (guanosine2251-2'-O)-methyltransferase